jgi:hypothetical protein
MLHVSGAINSRPPGQMNKNNDPQKTLHYCKTRIRKRLSSPLQRLPAPASTAANDTNNQSKHSIDQIKEEQTQASQDSNDFFFGFPPPSRILSTFSLAHYSNIYSDTYYDILT